MLPHANKYILKILSINHQTFQSCPHANFPPNINLSVQYKKNLITLKCLFIILTIIPITTFFFRYLSQRFENNNFFPLYKLLTLKIFIFGLFFCYKIYFIYLFQPFRLYYSLACLVVFYKTSFFFSNILLLLSLSLKILLSFF